MGRGRTEQASSTAISTCHRPKSPLRLRHCWWSISIQDISGGNHICRFFRDTLRARPARSLARRASLTGLTGLPSTDRLSSIRPERFSWCSSSPHPLQGKERRGQLRLLPRIGIPHTDSSDDLRSLPPWSSVGELSACPAVACQIQGIVPTNPKSGFNAMTVS